MPITWARTAECPTKELMLGPSGERVEVLEVARVVVPGLLRVEERPHVVVGDGLHAAKEIGDVVRLADGQAQAAAPEQNGRHPVTHGLDEPWRELDLGVVVRVTVDEARHDPFAAAIDLAARLGAQGRLRDGCDSTVGDADVSHVGGATSSVEYEAPRKHDIRPRHAARLPRIWPHPRASVTIHRCSPYSCTGTLRDGPASSSPSSPSLRRRSWRLAPHDEHDSLESPAPCRTFSPS